MRTIAETAAYAYSVSDEGVWVNLYGSNVLDTQLPGGGAVKLRQRTDYPWEGTIQITLESGPSKEFSLFLRVPGWAQGAHVAVNGKPRRARTPGQDRGQYFEIRRSWSAGDRVELVLPMPVQLLEAHPLVEETRNQVAVRRGPIVYCLESVDLPKNVKIADVAISPDDPWKSRFDKELLAGVTILEGKARSCVGGRLGQHSLPGDIIRGTDNHRHALDPLLCLGQSGRFADDRLDAVQGRKIFRPYHVHSRCTGVPASRRFLQRHGAREHRQLRPQPRSRGRG